MVILVISSDQIGFYQNATTDNIFIHKSNNDPGIGPYPAISL